jgi:NitT/TauT family transport system ATP-binding protein
MSGPAPALRAESVTLHYPGVPQPVIAGFDVVLQPGEIVAVLGPSGVGKSSLLRTLAGLETPSAGRVFVGDTPIVAPHPRVAIAFQDPSLLPWLTLEKNVAFGLDFRRQPALDRQQRRARVEAAMTEVGLTEYRTRYPAQLSGGMAQRTALARCIARNPHVLLLDEPFGALDEVTRAEMQRLLLKLVSDLQTATLLITHDIDEALLLADRILLLGGKPAHEVASWTVDLPKPREDMLDSLDGVRTQILHSLHAVLRRH